MLFLGTLNNPDDGQEGGRKLLTGAVLASHLTHPMLLSQNAKA